jgi:serine/threonine/tyrosine-interacting protein
MSDHLTTHARADAYTFRMPTPPRIVIPPMSGWNHVDTEWQIGPIVSHADASINIDFLDADACREMVMQKNAPSWQYNHRREAQAIIPFLYLGPYSAARDRDFLRREGITMVLGIIPPNVNPITLTAGPSKAANELGIASETIIVSQDRELISVFPLASRAINTHLRELYNRAALNPSGGIRPGKVLLYCSTGCDHSAGVAAAYLLENFESVDYVKACQICSKRRFCCSFEDNMKQLLRSYNDIIAAKRTVRQADPVSPSGPVQPMISPFLGSGPQGTSFFSPRPVQPSIPSVLLNGARVKRGREVEDDEMDLDEEQMDEDRFVGREFKPFN